MTPVLGVVLGVVLAGGASRRMGTPKALVPVDGSPMARRVARALREGGAHEVVVVGGDPAWAEALGGRHVADRWPGLGPLGGLATAVQVAHDEAAEVVVVAACDQPDLPSTLITSLVDRVRADPDTVAAVAATPDGRRHPFPSAWRAGAAPTLAALVEGGHRRADAGLHAVRVVEVSATEIQVADIDTPDQLERRRSPGSGRSGPYTGPIVPEVPEDDVDVPEIDVVEAARLQAAGTPVIDVREANEYVEGHVPGAPLIPLASVPDRLDEVPSGGQVLVICRSGARSARAVEFLRAHGLDAVNVAGGTLAWIEAGQTVVVGDERGA